MEARVREEVRAERVRVVGVVRKAGGAYELVVRWFLGQLDRLPLPGDRSRVKVEWMLKGAPSRYLRADGTFGDEEAHLEAAPRNFFMLDAPRAEERVDAALPEKVVWKVAREPKRPVDINLILPTLLGQQFPPDEGFGVYHLLRNSHRARAEWAAAKLLMEHVPRALKAVTRKLPARSLDLHLGRGRNVAEEIARHLAYRLVRHGPRPTLMPQHLSALTRRLRAAAARHEPAAAGAFPEDILSRGPNTLASRWAHLAVAAEVFKDEAVRQMVGNVITPADDVRQAVGLRLVQGGKLLDYWCNPDVSAPNCGAGERGRQYPASEVLGLGLTVGGLSADLVRELADGASSLGLMLHVEHVPTPVRVDSLADHEGLAMSPEFDGGLLPGCYPVETKEIKAALDAGSSLPPVPPKSARLCWDLVQTNAGFQKKGELDAPTLGYLTGDGRVEILVEPPDLRQPPGAPPCVEPGVTPMRVGGFNVYGIWESAKDPDAQHYFENPDEVPTLAGLKKRWLVTRRYSHRRDLAKALEETAAAAALADPPWLSVWHREKNDQWHDGDKRELLEATLADGAEADSAQMPNLLNEGFTTYSLDLRAGVPLQPADPAAPTPAWDPRAFVNTDWTPLKDRDNRPAGARPQRYRFFVTTVDCFEQESEPVAVWTNDRDAGDPDPSGGGRKLHLFEPQRRAALLPPPESDPNVCPTPGVAGRGRGLKLDPRTKTLRVWWETPYLAANSGNTDQEQQLERAPTRDLLGAVVLYRRPLRGKIEAATPEPAAPQPAVSADPADPTTLPQWQQEIARLKREGWARVEGMADLRVAPPEEGEIWQRDFGLKPWADEGFEYVAVLSVRVRDEVRAFWTRDAVAGAGGAAGRRAQLVRKKDTTPPSYELDEARITETPAQSDAVATGVEPVPNEARPRRARVTGARFREAQPILPPPGIFRDSVLLRLLANTFRADLRPYPPGSGDPVEVTPGQEEMVEAALARTKDLLPSDDLSAARAILAADFRKPAAAAAAKEYGRNPTIGFRGLHEVEFSYRPFSAEPPHEESEASKFRVYAVRVPLDAAAARPYATFSFAGPTRVGGEYHFPLQPTDPRWPKLLPMLPAELNATDFGRGAAARAAVVRLLSRDPRSGRAVSFDGVMKGARYEAGTVMLGVRFEGQEPPDGWPADELQLFMAQPAHDIRRPDTSAGPETYKVFLPVGGGLRELFAWWVVSVSAQDREAGHDPDGGQSVILVQENLTTQPETPQFFTVMPPTDNETHWLDPRDPAHGKWMPSDVSQPNPARSAPRLLVVWQPPVEPGHVAISRKQRRVGASVAALFAGGDLAAWRALVRLEAATAQDVLEVDDLRALRGWLRGETVDLPGEGEAVTDEPWHIRPGDGMETGGVKQLDFPDIPGGRASAFIDYYLHERHQNPREAMDGNWEYDYRAMTYVDLGPGKPEKWRFLYSRPTAWSGYRLPETPAFQVRPGGETELDNNPEGPEVVWQFRLGQGLVRLDADAEAWSYRVIVRRRSPYALKSEASAVAAAGWVLVGRPLTIRQAAGHGAVSDRMLERADPGETLELDYEILVSQYSVGADGREQLIRATHQPRLERVTLRPSGTPGMERTYTKEFVLG